MLALTHAHARKHAHKYTPIFIVYHLPIKVKLAHKGRKVAMLKVLWDHISGKLLNYLHHKGQAIIGPVCTTQA
jgi:hypothetical protein